MQQVKPMIEYRLPNEQQIVVYSFQSKIRQHVALYLIKYIKCQMHYESESFNLTGG